MVTYIDFIIKLLLLIFEAHINNDIITTKRKRGKVGGEMIPILHNIILTSK